MDIIILAGNSLHNKEWAEELAKNLKSLGNCYVQNYRHWETGEKSIDFEYEIKKLSEYVKGKEDYVLVGKSAGAIAILEALSRKVVSPKKCVLMGLPIKTAKGNGEELKNAIQSSNIRKEFIQNDNDPYGAAKSVKDMLISLKIKDYSFTETKGDTHDYTNYRAIIEAIKK
jgi:hypothetical protein